jgi:hypothetical protein
MINLNKQHNERSRKFFEHLLFFIEGSIVNAVNSNEDDKNKILTSALLKIKDAMFAEIVKDNFADALKSSIDNENNKKNENLANQKDLNQEKK